MAAFEDRLTEMAGAEALKSAKQMLKNKQLYAVWRDRDQFLHGVFRTPGGTDTECSVASGDAASCDCSVCGKTFLCSHGCALLMYSGRFHLSPPKAPVLPAYYAGMKPKALPQLAERGSAPCAKLKISVADTAPHAPSKWEYMILSVKLESAKREYTGNLNNIRQLYFDKSLSVVLKYDDFSLHDQQLIRFLALYGEADHSNIALNSEQTAEFFHALPGFPRFCHDGRQINVHPERAEAVLAVIGGKVAPGIMVQGAVLAFPSARVIVGKAGCWVGKDDEYFFIGGSCEAGFLRNFFRCQMQVKGGFDKFPLPQFKVGNAEPEVRKAAVLLDIVTAQTDDPPELRFDYLYRSGNTFTAAVPRSGRLAIDSKGFWKRDWEFERRFENILEMYGCTLADSGGAARFASSDAAALFLDKVLPELTALYPEISLSSALAAVANGGNGLSKLAIKCEFLEKGPSGFKISFALDLAGIPADFNSCSAAANEGKKFISVAGRPAVIPDALGVFLRASAGMLRNIDAVGRTFELPLCNIAYYNALAADLPGAMIPELLNDLPPLENIIGSNVFEFKGELRNYQKEGVAFMQFLSDRNFNALCADEMGLGKTVQLLALLASRMRKDSAPSLIVCPASLVANWEREANRFVPSFRVAAPSGSSQRKQLLADPSSFDLLVLSYASARLSARELHKIRFSYLVLDEAQHIKNPGSGNTKNCKDLTADHRIVLSGTPLENSPDDLWSVMDFLQPGMLGTLPQFRRRYAGIADNPELQRDLTLRTAPFIKRRTKSEVATDLPERSEQQLFCDFTPAQGELYEKILAEGREKINRAVSEKRKCSVEIFSTLLRLRQLCCHPGLLPDGIGNDVPSAKTELLMELLHETIDSGHKVLLFSQFTSMLKLLIPELDAAGIPFEYLDGATKNRQQCVDNFNNDPDIPLFLLSLKAGGTGLNLTSADTVFIYDPWWNPAIELQAADRTHRIGQTRPVSIGKLVMRNSIEEKILQLQSRKRELFYNLIESPGEAGGIDLSELRKLLGII